MKHHLLPLLMLVFFAGSLSAQNVSEYARADYRRGEEAILNKKYKQAIKFFRSAVEQDTGFVAAYRMLGASYELSNDYENAARYYRETLQRDSMFSRALYYQLADALYKSKRYNEALDYFYQYQALQSLPPDRFGFSGPMEVSMEERFVKRLPDNIKAVQVAMDSIKFLQIENIVNMGDVVNSKDEEVFPALTTDQQHLYFTRFEEGKNNDDLLISSFRNGHWTAVRPISKFNTRGPEGYSALMRDGRRMYLTVCRREGIAGTCDIWEAIAKGDRLSQIQPVEGLVNSDEWDGQASISCDGKQLFFASKRPGGLGGSDIWMSERMDNGFWGPPVNLGSKVNTDGNEQAPYITDDGRTLYFSSDGHPGMGSEDIYMSWKDYNTGQWALPINLKPPINTGFRETGFFLAADGRSGYFSSDREGGYGGLDIYRFELNEKLSSDTMTFVEGFVLDSVMRTPISGAQVQLGTRPPVTSDEDGRFFICAYANELIDIRVTDQERYYPYHANILIPHWENTTYYDIDLLLQPMRDLTRRSVTPMEPEEVKKRREEKVYEHTVFFQFDDYELTSEQLNQLADFIKGLRGKEIVKSEVFGYADNIGTDIYNLRLSEERAKEVGLYLVNNGILIDQIYMEGKGELDNDDPRSRNRRVEVRIVVFE